MTTKTYLSRREILLATKNHRCFICGQVFSQAKMPVVLPDRTLVHIKCQQEATDGQG